MGVEDVEDKGFHSPHLQATTKAVHDQLAKPPRMIPSYLTL